MGNFVIIQQKLEEFIRKYYVNELIKGAILFIGFGLLYSIILLSLEYFLWLNSIGRSIMFWSFIAVQVFLIIKYLAVPVTKLFKLSRGLDYVQASKIIGNHFPEVKDKLLNVLQLKNNSAQSELLIASIEQKTDELQAVPFKTAVDFKSNLKYAKFAILPVLIIMAVSFTGHGNMFSESYERVVNYKMAYEPPAPFSFMLLNENLRVKENNPFIMNVEIKGKVIPESATIEYEDQTYFLKQISPGHFQYSFDKIDKPIEFKLAANGIYSLPYKIDVVKVPKMQSFEMYLDYPSYTQKSDASIKGTGNATVPEGTKIRWNIATEATEEVALLIKDSTYFFKNENDNFSLGLTAGNNFPYQISTSNNEVKDHEKLSYAIKVINDEHPKLVLEHQKDTVDNVTMYFRGQASDDYGVSNVRLVYYRINDPENAQIFDLKNPNTALTEFVHAFPGNLDLEKGESYQYYFQVFDNDAVNGAKSVKSKVFEFRKATDSELEDEKLQKQKESITGMDKSVEEMELSKQELQELKKLQKEKKELDYNDRKKLKEFLERQKKQEELMKHHQEKLKKNLDDSEDNGFKKELERRLDMNEERLQENEKLRKELEKYTDKINKEELGEKLEKMSKQNKVQKQSMEQLLELTKRYYVQEKHQKLTRDLESIAKKQEELSEKDGEENTKEKQEGLTKEFKKFQKGMKELEKENEELQKPMDLQNDEEEQQEIEKEQKGAEEKLGNDEKAPAQEKQKNAAKKMQKMQKEMGAQMQMQGGEAMSEDAEMLRQILDNLIRFSFEQESLLDDFKGIQAKSPDFSKKLRKQNVLKTHFRHVDDSLYSLALRNPMVTEKIFEKLTDVEFNIDKSLERLAENEISQGVASQQYVVTGANDLALMLSELLESMQQMMSSGSGGGKSGGKGFQLPDIIKKQGQLGDKMQEGMKKGQEGKSGEGEKGQNGEGKNSGESKDGNQGKGGENGKGESQGQGDSNSEQMNGELYEIYQQQQLLREQLKDMMEKEGYTKEERNLLKHMEEVEQDLLNKGFSNETLRKMLNVKHKLLELEDASLRQGQEQKRESKSNELEYEKRVEDPVLKAKEYFNTSEILNRQVLPLRQIYKIKVQEYFGVGND